MSSPKQTFLYEQHLAAQAKMVEFYGWLMPLHYGSALKEHLAVRESAGIFDVSHMSIIDMIGAGGRDFLRRLMTRDIDELNHRGRACYTCMCNEHGGIIDDVLIYYRGPDNYRLVFNASTKDRVISWLNEHAQGYAIGFQIRQDLAMLAIQGPKAIEIFSRQANSHQLDQLSTLKRFNAVEVDDWFIARTGYTGEDGLEIMLPGQQAPELWQNLILQGAQACGLAARDSLRLEAGLMLNGQDMNENITPLESGLDWTISWNNQDREFVGKPHLLMQKEENRHPQLVGISLDAQAILRHGQAVFHQDQVVGEITSGIYSPWLKKSLAYVRIDAQAKMQTLEVDIRGKRFPIKCESTRFYTPSNPKKEQS
jgi:aminomethyltransferase